MGTLSAGPASANVPYTTAVNGWSELCMDARMDATWNPTDDGDPVQLWNWNPDHTSNQLWARVP